MQKAIPFKDKDELGLILGIYDRNARAIRENTGAKIFVRNGEIHVMGSRKSVEKAADVLLKVREIAVAHGQVPEEELRVLLGGNAKREMTPQALSSQSAGIFRRQIEVEPRTPGQAAYMKLMDENSIVISVGPAGTGKTLLAISKAVTALRTGAARRIILVRPVVEAGERLGFLPGDIEAKINPYLRPVYDALNRFLEFGQLRRLIDNDVIEIVPLAYMRGRTLDDAYIVLDEGQNATHEQMKMFLTRLGERSKMVVTGDITQIDLPAHKGSGLVEAIKLFRGVIGIGVAELTNSDIVRHPLVQKIVEVYERHEKRR
ncbi:MAG TPA: PhoH family protein [Planctomycetota bacterium]|nr:PhoH family protein [Planctomycetota bacterium]